MNGEGLLGPIPDPWEVQEVVVSNYYVPYYFNTITKTVSVDDPRLDTLSVEWERIPTERTADDPLHFAFFKNRYTGKILNSDPRMLPTALEERGLNLRLFPLV
jgi:hypothetical protein